MKMKKSKGGSKLTISGIAKDQSPKEPNALEYRLSQLETDLKSAHEDGNEARIKEISRNVQNLKRVITYIKSKA